MCDDVPFLACSNSGSAIESRWGIRKWWVFVVVKVRVDCAGEKIEDWWWEKREREQE